MANRLLSFFGEALIQSVLFSTQVYWCSSVLLHERMLKEIEGMLKGFLMVWVESRHTGVNVNWELVCTPKMEGGLGFMPLTEWNKATMLMQRTLS